MWCGVVWCGVVWCGVVWCGVVWCGVVWCGVVWCGVVWCGVVCCVVLRCVVLRCVVLWCVVVRCVVVVCCGVVWCGVLWCVGLHCPLATGVTDAPELIRQPPNCTSTTSQKPRPHRTLHRIAPKDPPPPPISHPQPFSTKQLLCIHPDACCDRAHRAGSILSGEWPGFGCGRHGRPPSCSMQHDWGIPRGLQYCGREQHQTRWGVSAVLCPLSTMNTASAHWDPGRVSDVEQAVP